MKRVVCSVMDRAAMLHGQPMFGVALGAVMRTFADEVNRNAADNVLAKHPADFELHYLADFDDETGEFRLPEGGVRVLMRGKDALVKENV